MASLYGAQCNVHAALSVMGTDLHLHCSLWASIHGLGCTVHEWCFSPLNNVSMKAVTSDAVTVGPLRGTRGEEARQKRWQQGPEARVPAARAGPA